MTHRLKAGFTGAQYLFVLLRSIPKSQLTHGMWVHMAALFTNLSRRKEVNPNRKSPGKARANHLKFSGHFHFCLTPDMATEAP